MSKSTSGRYLRSTGTQRPTLTEAQVAEKVLIQGGQQVKLSGAELRAYRNYCRKLREAVARTCSEAESSRAASSEVQRRLFPLDIRGQVSP